MLKRLFHLGPDVPTLRQRKDVPGLVRALGHESAEVVGEAAEALAALHEEGDDPVREQVAGSAGPLLEAYVRWSGAWPHTVAYALIRALGETGATAARDRLMSTVTSDAVDDVQRGVAMDALARISGAALGPWFQGFLDDPGRGQHAAFALVSLGDEGLRVLREHLLRPARLAAGGWRGHAANALEKTAAGASPHAAAAAAILAEVDAAELETQRQRERDEAALTARLEAEAGETAEARRRHEELAKRLVAKLGGYDWVKDGGIIQPGQQRAQYVAALERFRRLGLPVREYEESESNEVSHFWAEVDFEGEVVVIDGLRGFRDV
jgi:hypothetical protein